MAEIKSTLDLVMARTKHMIQSPEERAREQAKEREQKARGILLRLEDHQLEPAELVQILDEHPQEEISEIKTFLLRHMVAKLGLEKENQPLLAGLDMLAGETIRGLTRLAGELWQGFHSRRNELSAGAASRVLEELAGIGITGSALQPKTEADPQAVRALEELARDYGARLEELKKVMLEKV